MRGLIAIWLGTLFGFVALFLIFWRISGDPEPWMLLLGLTVFTVAPLLLLVSREHRQAAIRASQWKDPRLAPRFLDLLDADTRFIRRVATESLIRLLPHVTTENASEFDRRHLAMLMTLAESRDQTLRRTAIRTLGLVGDLTSIQDLDKLRRKSEGGPNEAVTLEAIGELRHRLAMTQLYSDSQLSAGIAIDTRRHP